MEADKILSMRKEVIDAMDRFPILVTTSDWFRAPDGQQYKAVWGKAKIISAKIFLGFDPPSSGSNWMMVFGKGENAFIIGGKKREE